MIQAVCAPVRPGRRAALPRPMAARPIMRGWANMVARPRRRTSWVTMAMPADSSRIWVPET